MPMALLLLVSATKPASSSSSQQQKSLNLLDSKVLLEPPAEFHTRCITFMNGVLLKANEDPEKVAHVLRGQCGEKKAGLETAPLPKKEVQACSAMAAKFAEQLKHDQQEKKEKKKGNDEDDEEEDGEYMVGEGVPAWEAPPKESQAEKQEGSPEDSEEEPQLMGKRLVSSSHVVDRHHDYYPLASAWCDELYTMAEKRRKAAKKQKRLRKAAAEKKD